MSRLRSFTSSKAVRVGGFLSAAALTATLVGVGVAGTGAYFQDTEAGNLSGGGGHLNLNVSANTSALVLTDLVPDVDQFQYIEYNIDATATLKSDVWLVFDATTEGYGRFSGAKGNPAFLNGGLGRFGHFAVSMDEGGNIFESYNLTTAPALASSAEKCSVGADGSGGSTARPHDEFETTAWCGVPLQIKLASNLEHGDAGTIKLTFGLTGRASTQNRPSEVNVPFKIIATQTGQLPNAKNF